MVEILIEKDLTENNHDPNKKYLFFCRKTKKWFVIYQAQAVEFVNIKKAINFINA